MGTRDVTRFPDGSRAFGEMDVWRHDSFVSFPDNFKQYRLSVICLRPAHQCSDNQQFGNTHRKLRGMIAAGIELFQSIKRFSQIL